MARSTLTLAREQLERIWKLPIRLLGDAMLRRLAWKLADELGWASTYDAEYLALTQLQANAFVTLNAELARKAEAVVRRPRSTHLAPADPLRDMSRAAMTGSDPGRVRNGRCKRTRNRSRMRRGPTRTRLPRTCQGSDPVVSATDTWVLAPDGQVRGAG